MGHIGGLCIPMVKSMMTNQPSNVTKPHLNQDQEEGGMLEEKAIKDNRCNKMYHWEEPILEDTWRVILISCHCVLIRLVERWRTWCDISILSNHHTWVTITQFAQGGVSTRIMEAMGLGQVEHKTMRRMIDI